MKPSVRQIVRRKYSGALIIGFPIDSLTDFRTPRKEKTLLRPKALY